MSSYLIPKFSPDLSQFYQAVNDNLMSPEFAKLCASQGFAKTDDENAAYCHETTKAPEYVRSYYKCPSLIHGMNMDSGAITRRPDGTQAGVVLDGISNDGFDALVTAHLAAQKIIHRLEKLSSDIPDNIPLFCFEILSPALKEIGELMKAANHPLKGAATVGFINTFPTDTREKFKIVALALGDVFLLHFSQQTKQVTALNNFIKRDDGTPGGYIHASGKLVGSASILTKEVESSDLLILTTDGTGDSLLENQREKISSFVIQNPFFDQNLQTLSTYDRPWEQFTICKPPGIEQLQNFVKENTPADYSEDQSPTAAKAAKRLSNYVRLINHRTFEYDKVLYPLKDDPTQSDAYLKAKKNEPSLVGNPDDCMVLAFTPVAQKLEDTLINTVAELSLGTSSEQNHSFTPALSESEM
jgi:hypothetical protein